MKKMNNGLLSILIAFLCSSILMAQEEINFEHKAIHKEIGKHLELSNFQLFPFVGQDSSLTQGTYFAISNSKAQLAYAYIGRVHSCRSGGCSVSTGENLNSRFEYFDYLILYSKDIEILSVKIFSYQATHGQEVCSRSWLKQFKGYAGKDKLEVGKNIDGISGATVSVYSLTFDIEKTSFQLKENLASWNIAYEQARQPLQKKGT